MSSQETESNDYGVEHIHGGIGYRGGRGRYGHGRGLSPYRRYGYGGRYGAYPLASTYPYFSGYPYYGVNWGFNSLNPYTYSRGLYGNDDDYEGFSDSHEDFASAGTCSNLFWLIIIIIALVVILKLSGRL